MTSAEITSSAAPVLIMPDVLDRATPLALIRRWHEQGHDEGRVAGRIKGEQTHEVYEALKKRRDHIIRDDALTQILATTIGRRVAPEMAKAFQFTAGFRFENFKIACYDAGRGDYFRRHRDSQGPGTGNRMFAMTLNLNSEEYEGGELIFPEYGQQRYKPPRGGAVVFSCPLVHEALPVGAGPLRARRSPWPCRHSRKKGGIPRLCLSFPEASANARPRFPLSFPDRHDEHPI